MCVCLFVCVTRQSAQMESGSRTAPIETDLIRVAIKTRLSRAVRAGPELWLSSDPSHLTSASKKKTPTYPNIPPVFGLN